MVTIYCAECGLIFSTTDDFIRRRKGDHKSFKCPGGHNNYFAASTEADLLKKKVEQLEKKLAATKRKKAAA